MIKRLGAMNGTRIHRAMRLALGGLAVAVLAASAFGDEGSEGEEREDKFKNVILGGEKKGKLRRGLDIEHTITLPAQAFEGPSCEPELEISYLQMNDRVRVDTTIANEGCGASEGAYAIHIRTRDKNEALTTREFPETWSRSDDADVLTTKYYEMNGEHDLVWVRVKIDRRNQCECRDTDGVQASTEAPETTRPGQVR